MTKKTYTKPCAKKITMMQETAILAGSQDNWADSKSHKQNHNLWDDEEEGYGSDAANEYDPYHGW